MDSQNKQLLKHLQEASITSLEAIHQYGITRLSGRIYDLRKQGVNIKTEHVKVPTRSGRTTTVARYSLAGKDE